MQFGRNQLMRFTIILLICVVMTIECHPTKNHKRLGKQQHFSQSELHPSTKFSRNRRTTLNQLSQKIANKLPHFPSIFEEDEEEHRDDPSPIPNERILLANDHLAVLQQYCDDHGILLMIRSPGVASVHRIEELHPTKGLDVHAKSSDWGPMFGFVPVDSALSKARTGVLNPSILAPNSKATKDVKEHRRVDHQLIKYGRNTGVGATQLRLSKEQIDDLVQGVTGGAYSFPSQLQECSRSENKCPQGSKCYKPVNGPSNFQGNMFCWESSSSKISWIGESGPLTPVYVWAYGCTCRPAVVPCDDGCEPMTGDYDLWLVGAHYTSDTLSYSSDYCPIQNYEDLLELEEKPVMGGETTTPTLEYEMIYCHPESEPSKLNLNHELGVGPNMVFMHASEMHNLDFTQPLPDTVYVILPSNIALNSLVISTDSSAVKPVKTEARSGVYSMNDIGPLMLQLFLSGYIFSVNWNYFTYPQDLCSKIQTSKLEEKKLSVARALAIKEALTASTCDWLSTKLEIPTCFIHSAAHQLSKLSDQRRYEMPGEVMWSQLCAESNDISSFGKDDSDTCKIREPIDVSTVCNPKTTED